MSTNKHSVKLVNSAERVTCISKECIGTTTEEIENKIDEGLAHARHLLSRLSIIPTKLQFAERSILYTSNNQIGIKLNLQIEYKVFADLTDDEKKQLETRIQREKKTPSAKDRKVYICSLHKKTTHLYKDNIKITAKGNTKAEVFENLKNKFWDNIPNFRVEYRPALEITVDGIHCWQTETGEFEAECTYSISQTINQEQKNNDDIELS